MVAECGGVCGGPQRRTAWSHAIAQQLLTRYGVVFRETAHAEGLPGGFSAVYDVLKAMEESGQGAAWIFCGGPGRRSLRCLRRWICCGRCGWSAMGMRRDADAGGDRSGESLWGADAVAGGGDAGSSLTRSVGARVVLCDGALVAYLRRGNPNLQVFLAGGRTGEAGRWRRRWRSFWWRGCASEDDEGGRGC
jgi:ATP-dependent Lhr-like helicase